MSTTKGDPIGGVKIVNAALDELGSNIILRGVVSPSCLHLLKVDDYQREAAPLTSLRSIIGALEKGQVLPDIELGMRGQRFTEKDGVFVLRDDLYIIDGQQRVNAAVQFLRNKPDAQVQIGATVHFGTTKDWERERFRILNTLRSKVSANVLLRNRREGSPVVTMLFGLTTADKSFVLHDRVSWRQRMIRGELTSALTVAKVVGLLHSHKAPTKRNSIDELVPALDKAVNIFGVQNMRENIRTFFSMVDECWGIRRVQYREGASYIKGGFLLTLARILSNHSEFWRQPDEKRLSIEVSLRRKIAQFPVSDPQVVNLSTGGGKSNDVLYLLMVEHINSGKRSKKIRPRVVHDEPEDSIEAEEELVEI